MDGLPEIKLRIPPTHPLIQCVLRDDLESLKTLLKLYNVDGGLKKASETHKWESKSKRWRDKLETLVHCLNTDGSRVSWIGSIAYINDVDFSIASGRYGEVFLGLRGSDGFELAVKRMDQTDFQKLKNEQLLLRIPKLDHRCVVQCVDFAEDKYYGYLFYELCEYTLDEYIRSKDDSLHPEVLVSDLLHSLRELHCQEPQILNRHLTPQNVLIDVNGRARLAGFGLSRPSRRHRGRYGRTAGERGWLAAETLKEDGDILYNSSKDIQVAGMLMYFILSGGHHPFDGKVWERRYNIITGKYTLDHVQDVVAKHLIERMIQTNPEARPSVEECLSHPFFWTSTKKVEYLRLVGNMEEVASRRRDNQELISMLDDYADGVSYTTWKTEFRPELVQRMERWIKEPYPEDVLGLLCFMRNLQEHSPDEAASVDLLSLFPHLFGCVFKFTIRQGWNLENPLKGMFTPEENQRYS